MPWFFAIAERDHAIQNPTSPEKIRLLGEHMRLEAGQRVLDMAAGRGGPAIILARAFGCHVLGVERSSEFVEAARVRSAEAGLERVVEVIEQDAREFPLRPETFDVAMCLGASFIWDGLPGTLAVLTPVVEPGGYVVVGEPFWRQWPLPAGRDDGGYVDLHGTVERFEEAGLAFVGVIAASDDDWDSYESLHWRALEEWLHENPAEPDAEKIRSNHRDFRDSYLGVERAMLGWAILIGWKPGAPPRRKGTLIPRTRPWGGGLV